jgi:hypothetical protein
MFPKGLTVIGVGAVELERAAVDRQAQRLALGYGLGEVQEPLAP